MPLPVPVPRSCPVCESPSQELIHDHHLAPIEDVSLHAGYRVVACSLCGMVYADGIPSQDAFDHYYQACSRYEDTPRMGLPSAVDQIRFCTIAEELAMQLPDRGLAIAEIGSSTGGLLTELKKRGFQHLLGLDPSPLCARTGRELHDLQMALGTIFDPLPAAPHDVVIAVGVLEHVRDLDRALLNLGKALKPGGLLYLEVPDLEGFHLTNEAPFQEFSTEHIHFFTRKSLDNLLACHGFQPAFGHIVQRIHSGGSSMQVVAWAFRHSGKTRSPERDTTGPAAARVYAAQCEEQSASEKHLMDRIVQEGQSIAVWGAGTVACRLMATTALRNAPIAAFLDSNPHLQGRSLGGVSIHPPQWLHGFSGPVLIASRGYAQEIRRILQEELTLGNPIITLAEPS
jgi:SAM-dependent methyltransferase